VLRLSAMIDKIRSSVTAQSLLLLFVAIMAEAALRKAINLRSIADGAFGLLLLGYLVFGVLSVRKMLNER